jgi:KUP system potassium uptake protein
MVLPDKTVETTSPSKLRTLSLAALGIVFGDIGTSPLYTFKTVLNLTGARPDAATLFGALSLVVWTLFLITTVKYVSFAMRVDNDGEGGILALMSLLIKRQRRTAIVALGLVGAALIYGDGAITPAISVLSALEGLNMATPVLQPYILPAATAILFALFAVQPLGTARIGNVFGPVMLLWFIAMATMGLWGIVQHPAVLAALNPRYGLAYLFSNGMTGFLVLGGVFLCVTGAEALYADMGHFGPRPIRLSWMAVVFPSLILNYAGQAALVLEGAPTDGNIFYRLCPQPLLIPLVILATVATIIASQSIITGAFSMTRQAIQLGWLPRLRIKQTSAQGYGQIYVGVVNWLLMIVTPRTNPRLRQIRQFSRRLRHRGVVDDANDLGTSVHCHARGVGLEPFGRRHGRRRFSPSRHCVFFGEHVQGRGRRLCAAAACHCRLYRDVGLAPWSSNGHSPFA